MAYTHEIDTVFADRIGPTGLDRKVYAGLLKQAQREAVAVGAYDKGLPDVYGTMSTVVRSLGPHAARLRKFKTLIVLGTGGSSLGGQTLCALADLGFGPRRGAPTIRFFDNVDPATFDELFARTDLKTAHVLAVSKSGTTAETLMQLFVILDRLRKVVGEAKLKNHVTVLTEPRDSALARLAKTLGCPVLDHDLKVGGRFSVFTNTSLLPAMVAGLNVRALQAGAQAVHAAAAKGEASAPVAGAALSVGLQRERGADITVLMPYVDRLAYFGLWYRQLWAESLGKGGQGTTPIRAMGTVDQHSQVQLYLGGPTDKMFTVLIQDTAGKGGRIARSLARRDPSLAYMAGRTMGDLLRAEADATAVTLAKNGRPTRVMRIAELNEQVLGGLLMHYMLETCIAARLMGVDAFDQPAVEEGKVLTREYLAAAT